MCIILRVDPNIVIRGRGIIEDDVDKTVPKKGMGNGARHARCMIIKRIKIQLIRFIGSSGKIKNAKAEGRKDLHRKPTRLFTKNQECRPVPIG